MPTEAGRIALDYLTAGHEPRRWAYCPISEVPGGAPVVAELVAERIVEVWNRPDEDAVCLTPLGLCREGVEIDERWDEFDVMREIDIDHWVEIEIPVETDAGPAVAKEWKLTVEVATVQGEEAIEMPFSCHSTADFPCWAHPIVQPKEVGFFELQYPELIPDAPREWYTDEIPEPTPALDEWDQPITVGGVPAYLDDEVRAYMAAKKAERIAEQRAKKAAKRKRAG